LTDDCDHGYGHEDETAAVQEEGEGRHQLEHRFVLDALDGPLQV
jgi:hypothetical protein